MQLRPRRSRRHLGQYLKDPDFADDLAIVTEAMSDTESPLMMQQPKLEKIEHIINRIDPPELKSLSGAAIKR